jgi:serine/threonine-protein kinase
MADVDPDQVRRSEPRIPGYRIEGVLGRGATGVVYRARQVSVDREVALKVLHPELVGAKGAEHRLQREARATARLAHPHIISAIDMGEVDGMWWYAMELVDGMSLAEKIRERPLSEREALRLFIPLVEALQHAFERGVVHRDVKPANILVERSGGRALLVDLGLAFADDDPTLTKSGATLGTPHYISPEQARDPSGADAQSDLWSLGATMYHAVCGRPPFAGDSVAEILSAVLYERVPDPHEFAPALSSGFVLVLRKCLTRDRAKRYATPAELLADLEKIRERRAPSVRRRMLEPLAHDRRRLVRIGGSIALVVAVASILIWIGLHNGDPQMSAGGGPDSGLAGRDADPIAALVQAAEGPASGLAPARERAGVLLRLHTLSDAQLERLEPLRVELERRLAAESVAWRKEEEARIDGLLQSRRFDDAAAHARASLDTGLSARVGTGALPDALASELAQWKVRQEQRVTAARTAAFQTFLDNLEAWFDQEIAPQYEAQRKLGHWRRARQLLTEGQSEWVSRVGASREGLSDIEVAEALSRLQQERVVQLRESLDAAWNDADGKLAEAVNRHVEDLKAGLESRTLTDAAARLRDLWASELEQRKLSADDARLGHEALTKGVAQLARLETDLASEDAQRGLFELDAETAPAWKARRYLDVARTFAAALSENWRAPVRGTLELRLREARLLEDLLERAAQFVTQHAGERTELRINSIVLAGLIRIPTSDPLANGFVLTLDSGRVYSLALRASEGASGVVPAVLGPEIIARFAGVPPEGSPLATAQDNLLRALFLMREGDAQGARALRQRRPMPPGDPLVADLDARLAESMELEKQVHVERLGEAQEGLKLVRRESLGGEGGPALQKRIDALIQTYPDALSEEEMRELRQLRDQLFARTSPAAPEVTVASVYSPTSIEDISTSRVRLRFDFNTARAGAFEPGSWLPGGPGWSMPRYARNDEELVSNPSPKLELREPLRPLADSVDVTLKLEQPLDAPPEMLVVTCAGFHVVFKNERKGGRALVQVDGKQVDIFQKPIPQGESTLQVRSWEPMRLLSASVEATRR